MKKLHKVGVLAFISICLVFYHYHLSAKISFDQVMDFDPPSVIDDSENVEKINVSNVSPKLNSFRSYKIYRDAIHSAVISVQKLNGLGPDIAFHLERELMEKLYLRQNSLIPSGSENVEPLVLTSKPKKPNSSVAPCKERQENVIKTIENIVPLYIITPTYRRPEQIPELTRMSHTLMLVKNVHWLVIEDARTASEQVTKFLNRTGLRFEHMIAPMPEEYKSKKGPKPRGVSNRNLGLRWVQSNAKSGVMYFADDDNSYDIELFDEIRKTKKVSMFPVGLCTNLGLSSPILENGKFKGFYDGWIAERKFPVDMAGFAVNVQFLRRRPNATMPYRAGYEEDGFLKSLAPLNVHDIEMLADNCTKVLVWHTQTKKNQPSKPLDMRLYGATNLVKLKEQII